MTVYAFIAAWVAGGFVFLNGMARHAPNDSNTDFQDCLKGLRRADPAAIVALIMFLAIWPWVFVAAKLAR